MGINPLFSTFTHTVIEPMTQDSPRKRCSMSSCTKRVFDVGAAAFAGLSNWPFYRGNNTITSSFGTFLKVCEGSSRFLFSLSNFETVYRKFSEEPPKQVIKEIPLRELGDVEDPQEEDAMTPRSSCCTKQTAWKVAVASLALGAQIPFVLNAYYTEQGSWVFPLASGVCDAAFTIASLWKSRRAAPIPVTDDLRNDAGKIEQRKQEFLEQIDLFLEQLPINYRNDVFIGKLRSCLFNDPAFADGWRSEELLKLILSVQKETQVPFGSTNVTAGNVALGIGALIALYLTTARGALAYQGIVEWNRDLDVLAGFSAAIVSLANVRFLTKICMSSALSYYQTAREITTHRYTAPLAYAVSPCLWTAGRVVTTTLAWFSFGTTFSCMRDHIPKAGEVLSGFAPIASGILLHSTLNRVFDTFVLWQKSKCKHSARSAAHVQSALQRFKKQFENASLEDIRTFLNELPKPTDSILATPGDRSSLVHSISGSSIGGTFEDGPMPPIGDFLGNQEEVFSAAAAAAVAPPPRFY